MNECTVCGLLFLGSSACPSCGSMTSEELEITGDGVETIEQRGGIPGMGELDESIRDVVGDEGIEDDEEDSEPTGTTLPFTIGGGATKEVSSLPFGVGSRSAAVSGTSDNGAGAITDEVPTVDAHSHDGNPPPAPDVESIVEQHSQEVPDDVHSPSAEREQVGGAVDSPSTEDIAQKQSADEPNQVLHSPVSSVDAGAPVAASSTESDSVPAISSSTSTDSMPKMQTPDEAAVPISDTEFASTLTSPPSATDVPPMAASVEAENMPAITPPSEIESNPSEAHSVEAGQPPVVKEIQVVHREPVPLPGRSTNYPNESETVPLPPAQEESTRPVKVKAVAISIDDEDMGALGDLMTLPSNGGESESMGISASVTQEAMITSDVSTPGMSPTTGGIAYSDASEEHYSIEAAEVNLNELYAEPEQVVVHDFSDDELTTEVQVDLDNIPDDAPLEDAIFAPDVQDVEPELFPAQALDVDTGGEPEMEGLLDSGFNALGSGAWDDAARSFRAMAAKAPENASILNNYGLALLQHAMGLSENLSSSDPSVDSQYEAAIMALRQAAKTDPEEPLILYNLGVALVSSGRCDKALKILDVVLERPRSPKVAILNARSVAHVGLGDFNSARMDLRSALEIKPDDPTLKSNLARVSPT